MSDLDTNQDVLLIRKHLVEHLGPPDEVFEVSGSPIPDSPVQALNLAYFAPAGPHSPVVFATCGASLYEMKDGRRIEGIVIMRQEPAGDAFDAVHRMLASFALFAESNDQVIRLGDVVRAPEELHQFCSMDAILFMPPIPFVETFHRVQLAGEKTVEIVWLLPVYESEASYALEHGPQALMMLFAAQALDLTEPNRDEANTLIDPSDAAEMAKRAGEENRKRAEAEGPKPIQPRAKPKTSRRSVGKGSFDVEEAKGPGGAVKISRRNKPKKKPTEPPPGRRGPPPPRSDGSPEPRPAPRARPAAPPKPAPKKKEGVRFDIGKKPVRDPKQPALPKRPEKKIEPKEDPEEAKKRRIAELKKKAQEAAARARARQQGHVEEHTGPIEAAGADRTAAHAAAQRRGAPKRAIAENLEDED